MTITFCSYCFMISSNSGTILNASNSGFCIRLKRVGLLACTNNSIVTSPNRVVSKCKTSSKAAQNSLLRDPSRWLKVTRGMLQEPVTGRMKFGTPIMIISESLSEEIPQKSENCFSTACKSLLVFIVAFSALLWCTPAQAAAESSFLRSITDHVDVKTNSPSSVESILAKLLAQRFREMSDEELVQVLQELLKASGSSLSSKDFEDVYKGSKNIVSGQEIGREDPERLVMDTAKKDNAQEMLEGTGSGREAFESSPRKSIVPGQKREVVSSSSTPVTEDAVDENVSEDQAKTRRSGLKDALEEKSAKAASSTGIGLPGGKKEGLAPLGTLETKNSNKEDALQKSSKSRQSGSIEGSTGTEVSTEREMNGENKDMTGLLWDEWIRRLQDEIPQESADVWRTKSNAEDFLTNLQNSRRTFVNKASDASSWIQDNREAVGRGLLVSGSLSLAAFISFKIRSFLAPQMTSKKEDIRAEGSQEIVQTSLSDIRSSEKGLMALLKAVPMSLKAAEEILRGSEKMNAKGQRGLEMTKNNRDSGGSSQRSKSPREVEPLPVRRQLEDDLLYEWHTMGKVPAEVELNPSPPSAIEPSDYENPSDRLSVKSTEAEENSSQVVLSRINVKLDGRDGTDNDVNGMNILEFGSSPARQSYNGSSVSKIASVTSGKSSAQGKSNNNSWSSDRKETNSSLSDVDNISTVTRNRSYLTPSSRKLKDAGTLGSTGRLEDYQDGPYGDRLHTENPYSEPSEGTGNDSIFKNSQKAELGEGEDARLNRGSQERTEEEVLRRVVSTTSSKPEHEEIRMSVGSANYQSSVGLSNSQSKINLEGSKEDALNRHLGTSDLGVSGENPGEHRDDGWTKTVATVAQAMDVGSSERKYGHARLHAPEERGARKRRGSEGEITPQLKPELDSFVHNESLWVRDADGVFIKHSFEIQERQGSRFGVSRNGSRKKRAPETSTARKITSSNLDKAVRMPSREGNIKAKKSSGNAFDYRQLFLMSMEDNITRNKGKGENINSKSKSRLAGSRPPDVEQMWPLRYGNERGSD